MTQVKGISEQLWSQGINHFIILSSSGEALQFSGDFSSAQKQIIAASILAELNVLIQKKENFQRISMAFDDAIYVATTFGGENESESFGVVVKHPVSSSISSQEALRR